MGGFLAAFNTTFSTEVLIFSLLTTLFLQILSNLANDYGDSVHGADSLKRKGPQRAVQSGVIGAREMKTAIYLLVLLSLASGLYLLHISIGFNDWQSFLFLLLGIMAIVAAINYTTGARPYGYSGFGDLSVLIFFGLVGVLGSYFLHSQEKLTADLILPALTCGFFSVAVLNVNNIRDIDSDREAGKRSIPVRIGRRSSVIYHWVLLGAGWLCSVAFTFINFESPVQFIFLITLPLFILNSIGVYKYKSAKKLDPFLRQIALSTFVFVLLFGLGLVLSK